jgi:Holliday junction resolvasome RuvABC endonuclease subunit
MRFMGIDPGTVKCGWVIMDIDTKAVMGKGHATLDEIRALIQLNSAFITCIFIENTVRYQVSNSADLLKTTIMVGRLLEVATTNRIASQLMTRPEVILKLTGKWPGRTNKVSKARLQEIVQSILGLEAPIRPQHANDAAALIVAATNPVEAIPNVKPIRKGRRPAQAKSSRRPKRS